MSSSNMAPYPLDLVRVLVKRHSFDPANHITRSAYSVDFSRCVKFVKFPALLRNDFKDCVEYWAENYTRSER